MRASFYVAVALAILPTTPLQAQAVFPADNGAVLTGVGAVNAFLRVPAWLNMEEDQGVFRENAQAAFELGLRRDGVRVEASAANVLICDLWLAHTPGIIFYHWSLKYFTYSVSGVHTLQWEAGGIVTAGRGIFNQQMAVGHCTDGFAREWLKWNPGR